MHWREGFRRSARATAIVYWLVAALAVGITYRDTVDSATYLYKEANPPPPSFGDDDPIAKNHFRDLIPAPPPPPTPSFIREGATAAAKMLGWWLLAYAVLLGAFRGLRWIARGFLDGRPA